jgi:hypothetical protein
MFSAEATNTNFIVFGLTIYVLKVSMLTITPLIQFECRIKKKRTKLNTKLSAMT